MRHITITTSSIDFIENAACRFQLLHTGDIAPHCHAINAWLAGKLSERKREATPSTGTAPSIRIDQANWENVAEQAVCITGLPISGMIFARNVQQGIARLRRQNGEEMVVHLDWCQPIRQEDEKPVNGDKVNKPRKPKSALAALLADM